MESVGNRSGMLFAWMRSLVVVAVLLAIIVGVPYAFLWTLFWIASDSWDFEGSSALKHWLLVKGSRIDRLGLVAPTTRPARYSVRFQEGTFPGWRVVGYESSVLPPAIISTYAERCRAMGLRITRNETASLGNDADGTEATLVCEIEPYMMPSSTRSAKGRRPPRASP
jgi:hypothetical protein